MSYLKKNRTIFDTIHSFLKELSLKVKGTSLERAITNAERLYKKALDSESKKVEVKRNYLLKKKLLKPKLKR